MPFPRSSEFRLMQIEHPYLLFLGDAPDQLAAKTAQGIAQWRRDWCLGQLRLAGCKADLGLPDVSLRQAAAEGARSLIVGVANRGGGVNEAWLPTAPPGLHRRPDFA